MRPFWQRPIPRSSADASAAVGAIGDEYTQSSKPASSGYSNPDSPSSMHSGDAASQAFAAKVAVLHGELIVAAARPDADGEINGLDLAAGNLQISAEAFAAGSGGDAGFLVGEYNRIASAWKAWQAKHPLAKAAAPAAPHVDASAPPQAAAPTPPAASPAAPVAPAAASSAIAWPRISRETARTVLYVGGGVAVAVVIGKAAGLL